MPNLLAIYIQSFYPQNSYQESVRYTSVALCAVGTSVTLRYLRSLRDSVCLLYKTFSLSLHISEEPFILLLHMIFALTTGISVYVKVDKTSFNSVPLCEIYSSQAKKYIYKYF